MRTYGKRTLLFATAIVAALCALLIPTIQAAREAANQMSCGFKLKCVALGIANYESAYGAIPLAIETLDSGKTWRSWRTRVYPTFLEQRSQVYDATSAWDASVNLRLINGTPIPMAGKDGKTVIRALDRVPWSFACPSCQDTTGVNYVVITGEGTVFPNSRSVRFVDITDGIENTLLVVESVTCTPDWIEPRDLDIKTMKFVVNSRLGPSISSFHSKGALVCFADFEVFCMTADITESELKALITIDGGEAVRREDLVARGVLTKR